MSVNGISHSICRSKTILQRFPNGKYVIPYLGSLYETYHLLISLSNSTSDPFENVIQVAIFGSRIDHLSSTFERFHKSATCQALERHFSMSPRELAMSFLNRAMSFLNRAMSFLKTFNLEWEFMVFLKMCLAPGIFAQFRLAKQWKFMHFRDRRLGICQQNQ